MIRVESALRPRGFGEICDAAVETLRRDLAVHATASLLVNAPLAAASLGLLWGVTALGKSRAGWILPLAAAAAALTLLRPLAQGAVALAARERVERGRAPSVALAWRGALRNGLALSFAGVAFWFAALAGGLVYVLPGLLFGGWCALAVPAAALEESGAFSSVFRSVKLLKGHAGRAIALLVFTLVAYGVLVVNAFAAVQGLLLAGRVLLGLRTAYWEAVLSPDNGLFATAVVLAVYVALEPWKACAFYHLHLDARIRYEALDLRQTVERLAEEAPALEAAARAFEEEEAAAAPVGAGAPAGGGGGATGGGAEGAAVGLRGGGAASEGRS
jgi:hypothetical protein